MDEEPRWPSCKPRGWRRLLVELMVKSGVAHGDLKRLLEWIWLSQDSATVADVSRNGFNWRVDFSDNQTDKRILFSSREFDKREIRALAEACEDGWFIDVGANTGYYTVRIAGLGVQTLALEPHPVAYRRLLYNIRLNALEDKVEALPIGVGAEGEAILFFSDREIGEGSIVNPEPDLRECRISLSPLASILSARGIRKVDAIKVDVEGAEDRVLIPFFTDAAEDLWPRFMLIESYHDHRWQTDVVEFLLGLGYRLGKGTPLNVFMQRP